MLAESNDLSSKLLTNFKIQPVETEGLDQTENSFSEKPLSDQLSGRCMAALSFIRIDTESGMVLIDQSQNRITKHKGDKRVGAFS